MNIVKDSFSNVRGLFTGLMLLLVTVAVSSCSGDHARILPEDCAGVVKIDVKSIFDKSGLKGSSDVKDWKEKILEAADKDFSSSTCKRIEEILDDPSELGVDLRKPVYIYAPSKSFPYAGFVAKVLDDDDLYRFLEMMADEEDNLGKFKEYDNYRTFVSPDGKEALAFNGDVLILAVDVEGGGRVTRDLGKRFDEMDKTSILDNPEFAEMDGRDDDVAMCLMMDNLMKVMPASVAENVRKGTQGFDVEGYSVLAGLSFGSESVDAYMETLAMSDKAKKQMKESADIQKEVTGKYLEKVSKEAFAAGGFGFDGPAFWKMICKNEAVRKLLDEEPEKARMIEDVVNTVSGEGFFALTAPRGDDKYPLLSGFVDIKNRSAVDALMAEITGLKADGNSAAAGLASSDSVAVAEASEVYDYDDAYDYWERAPVVPEFSRDPVTGCFRYCLDRYADNPKFVSFGTTEKMFFFSNEEGFKPEGKVSASLAKADYAGRIKGKTSFMVVDFRTLFENAEMREEISRTPFKNYSDNLSTFEMYSEKPAKVTASLRFRDMGKNETPLSLIVSFIADCVNRYA